VTLLKRLSPRCLTYLIPAACLLLAGLFSLKAGKDYSWDLRNYHYYNAWAFLHGRLDIDVLPANIQGYINPLIELPFYLLASADVPDYIVGFAMGVPAGLATWLVWLMTGRLSQASPAGTRSDLGRTALRALTTVAAVTGAAGSVQWGTTSGEWPVTCLIILALFLVLRPLHARSKPGRYAIGPLLGFAVGLKLTALPFAGAVAIAYAWQELTNPSRNAARQIVALVAGGLVATLATMAPWGWQLWERYHNPLFPFFNGIFRSDMVEKTNWRDARFLPRDAWEFVRLPWDLAFRREARYGDSIVRDRRILMGCIACVACVVGWLSSPGRRHRLAANQAFTAALVFLLALLGWASITAIYRYAIGLEITACLTVFAALVSLVDARGAKAWACLIAFIPVIGTSVVSLGRTPFNGGPYFQETFPSIPPGSLVINYVPDDPPMGYLSPRFGVDVTVVKPMSNLSRGHLNPWFQERIREIVANGHGRVFLIAAHPYTTGMLRYLEGVGLSPDENPRCGSIASPAFELRDYVCELRRKGP
jgi:hypothetical protein